MDCSDLVRLLLAAWAVSPAHASKVRCHSWASTHEVNMDQTGQARLAITIPLQALLREHTDQTPDSPHRYTIEAARMGAAHASRRPSHGFTQKI